MTEHIGLVEGIVLGSGDGPLAQPRIAGRVDDIVSREFLVSAIMHAPASTFDCRASAHNMASACPTCLYPLPAGILF